ncbi:hypothetical protein L1987_15196 [Smallanthus sonchifolius]|uniref:Uncharacterized protein n=1 Tax=Smallanthus sonchifolius TaxID=185202 RepID=A0ACB9J7H0_9ASTR|nr:hypothetical protein L1987_15196 [Smallanthus sonchifolius]
MRRLKRKRRKMRHQVSVYCFDFNSDPKCPISCKIMAPPCSIVMECLATRTDIVSNGEIMVLDRFCPWKLHLFELEQKLKTEPSIKYVLSQ